MPRPLVADSPPPGHRTAGIIVRRVRAALRRVSLMIRAFAALRDNLHLLGFGNGLLYCADRVLAVATRGYCKLYKYYFVAQPVPDERPREVATATRTRIHRETNADNIVRSFPRPPEVIARRLADGATCLVAERDGEAIGFIWLKFDSYEEDEVRCLYLLEPAKEMAWDFDAFIAPRFRMSRAFVQLWDAAFERLREHGCRWSVSRISAFNPGSLNSQRRLGAVHLHTAVFTAVGPAQLTLLSCRPFVHLSLGRRSRPTIVLHLPR
jgi:hypothetical protein